MRKSLGYPEMVKKLLNTLLILISVGFLWSCGTTYPYAIEVLKPAEVIFPVDAQKVVILVNTPKSNNNAKVIVGGIPSEIEVDSLPFSVAWNLNNKLLESSFFDTVYVYENSLNGVTLKSESYVNIKNITSADILIELKSFKTQATPQYRYDFSTNKVISKALFYIWNLNNFALLNEIVVSDTLSWDNYYNNYDLPPLENSFLEGAWNLGAVASVKMVPGWIVANREFLVPSKPLFEEAILRWSEKQFENAMAIWKYIFDNTQRESDKARAAYNLAIAFEASGKLNLAHDWILKSIDYFTTSNLPKNQKDKAARYYKILEQRLSDEEIIRSQFEGE